MTKRKFTKIVKNEPSKLLRAVGGKPPKPVDPQLVYDMARIGCTYEEIAVCVGMQPLQLRKRFANELQKGDQEGKSSLRRLMQKQADRGNVVMQIWLSKQRLGYRDRQKDEAQSIVFNVNVKEVP